MQILRSPLALCDKEGLTSPLRSLFTNSLLLFLRTDSDQGFFIDPFFVRLVSLSVSGAPGNREAF